MKIAAPLAFVAFAMGSGLVSSAVRGNEARPLFGTIEGVVRYLGNIPESAPIAMTGDAQPLMQVNAAKGLRSAVVFLADAPAGPVASLPRVTITQQGYTFRPLLAAVREGQEVRFTNDDPANHSVRSVDMFEPNRFNVYTNAGQDYVHRFRVHRKGRPVVLSCDIHDWMTGWVYVFDHPFYALTDAEGRFRLENVPPGTYQVAARHPGGNLFRDVQAVVQPGRPLQVEVVFTAADLRPPLQ